MKLSSTKKHGIRHNVFGNVARKDCRMGHIHIGCRVWFSVLTAARMSFSSPESKHRDSNVVYDSDSSWQCSKYRNMYVSCTSHFIKTSTIEDAILEAIKAMAQKSLRMKQNLQNSFELYGKARTVNLLTSTKRTARCAKENG